MMMRDFFSRRPVTFGALALAAMISLFVGLGVGLGVEKLSRGATGDGSHDHAAAAGERNSAGRKLPDFVVLARRLRPVVVNVSATRPARAGETFEAPMDEGTPQQDFLDEFFGAPVPPGGAQRRSVGSGFIIGPDGSILTNYHVIEKAEKVSVKLSDKREFQAKVVAKDARTDIAVIKIDAPDHFPTARLGNSDRLEVGEWVMAVGNPFGLDSSVTSGIVSAKGRHIGAGPYDSFIQTDASINPGNSGGPLVNVRGEVVGINMAIVSQTGGNIGIGFATPINQIKDLLPELRSRGLVTRGWLGVGVRETPPEIAESLGLNATRGALIVKVEEGGPAHRGGIRPGDVITEFDGKEIKEAGDLPPLVARTQIEKKVRVKVFREAKEVSLAVTVGKLKEPEGSDQPRKAG